MKSIYKVKDVAAITDVSIRTLHYYDEIGLLTPSGRTEAGYRLYTDEDLLRMQQILIGRSLGLPLEDIRLWLDDPRFDYITSLRTRRTQLLDKLQETNAMIDAIDRTLAILTEAKIEIDFEVIFDGFDPTAFQDEVQSRWGDTKMFEQTQRITSNYTKEDWLTIKSESDTIFRDAAAAMAQAVSPDSATASDIVERYRLHNCRWYYELSPQMHASLADMWEFDDRYSKNIDRFAPGLTAWLAKSVRAVIKRP
ncbi:MAG: MerR family transcriptional regulator [Pseudomonadota bacterium]